MPETEAIAVKRLQLLSLLSASESLRQHSFLKPERAQQHLAGRMLLRYALHEQGIRSQRITLEERAAQAPLLLIDGRSAALHFSISHSHDLLACAISRDGPVGLDVEADRERDVEALAAAAFDIEEAKQFKALAGGSFGSKKAAFYHLWCAREARYKWQSAAEDCAARMDMAGLTELHAALHFPRHPEFHICVCSGSAADRIEVRDVGSRQLLDGLLPATPS
jgi:4'-phosphopantetheinyl transferase